MEMNEKKDKIVWKFDKLEQMKEKMKQIFLPLTEESNVVCVFSVLRSFFDSLAHEISSHLRVETTLEVLLHFLHNFRKFSQSHNFW